LPDIYLVIHLAMFGEGGKKNTPACCKRFGGSDYWIQSINTLQGQSLAHLASKTEVEITQSNEEK